LVAAWTDSSDLDAAKKRLRVQKKSIALLHPLLPPAGFQKGLDESLLLDLSQAMKRMGRGIRGVTLVEVMIILVIIALLLAMAIPALQKIKQSKHDREKAAAEAEAVPTRP
jgi:hypothetical protein